MAHNLLDNTDGIVPMYDFSNAFQRKDLCTMYQLTYLDPYSERPEKKMSVDNDI